jgi:hypothetical protein
MRSDVKWQMVAVAAALGTTMFGAADPAQAGDWKKRGYYAPPGYVYVPPGHVRYYAPAPVVYAAPPIVVYPQPMAYVPAYPAYAVPGSLSIGLTLPIR